ncbi:hypothetical protein [Nocardioides sp.]|uniref:hypothetical protein n=1 Tax=Nocardioides sp. TaxID=35761 RepID=UPI002EDA048C
MMHSTGHTIDRTVVEDPRPGDVLTVPAGSRLHVRFSRTLSSWSVADRPGHLVPLEEGDHGFEFLVFGTPEAAPDPLRLVRQRADRTGPSEVRDLIVLVG